MRAVQRLRKEAGEACARPSWLYILTAHQFCSRCPWAVPGDKSWGVSPVGLNPRRFWHCLGLGGEILHPSLQGKGQPLTTKMHQAWRSVVPRLRNPALSYPVHPIFHCQSYGFQTCFKAQQSGFCGKVWWRLITKIERNFSQERLTPAPDWALQRDLYNESSNTHRSPFTDQETEAHRGHTLPRSGLRSNQSNPRQCINWGRSITLYLYSVWSSLCADFFFFFMCWFFKRGKKEREEGRREDIEIDVGAKELKG